MTAQDGLVWRAPNPADAEALGRMHHQAWVDTYAPLLPERWFDDHPPSERVDLWHRVLAAPPPAGVVRTAVFTPDGDAVGWTIAGPARGQPGVEPVREHELWGLYVARPWLGSGLGQALLDHAVGDRPAELWRAEGNERAAAFYRRNGFADDGARAPKEGAPLVEVRMVR